MSFDPSQIRDLIEETLIDMTLKLDRAMDSKGSRELLLMTAAHESHLGAYLCQVKGPAVGMFQMEPATYKDLMDSYIGYRPDLASYVEGNMIDTFDPYELRWNLKAAIITARLQYYRVAEPLPTTVAGLGFYAKEHWNTYEGKATEYDYVSAFNKYYNK